MTEANWRVFQLGEAMREMARDKVGLKELLHTKSLSCVLYHFPAHSTDMQTAHEEDELYYVIKGKARLRVGEEQHVVQEGTLMYVHAACDHAFFDIEEDLTTLAFYGTSVNARRP